MKLYYPITVDLYQPYPLPIMEAQQNNIGRGALVTLTAQGAVITPDGESIQMYAKKPDGTISYLACTLNGSQIECDFTNQMLAIPGMVQVELQMIGGESGAETEITTPIFCVRINPSNIDEGAIESANEFTALVDALAEVEDLKKNGLKGDAATVTVGSTTTGDPGTDAAVSNSGTTGDAVLNFTIPRGADGSMWYYGDAITGNSTSGTVFAESGITSANMGDKYLNTSSGADKGNVYTCTVAGDAETAQWVYIGNIEGPQGPEGPAGMQEITFAARSAFPESGQENMLYIDNTLSPAVLYLFNTGLNQYVPINQGSVEFTGSGTTILMQSQQAPKSFRSLEVYGKSTQDGTPSPENPVPIVSAGEEGEIEIEVYRVNLINSDVNSWNKSGWGAFKDTIFQLSDGIKIKAIGGWTRLYYDVSGMNGKTLNLAFDYRQIESETTSPNTEQAFAVAVQDENVYPSVENMIFNITSPQTVKTHVSVSFTARNYLCFFLRVDTEGQGETRTIEITNIMLNVGDTELTYKPYKTPQIFSLSTPGGLPGIPVSSGGNYTDETGQQWIADVKDYGTGKYTQNVVKKILTSDMDWEISVSGKRVYTTISEFTNKENGIVMCNYATMGNWTSDTKGTVCVGNGLSPVVGFSILDFPSVEDIKSFLDSCASSRNPVYAIAPLATPIVTDIPAEEMEAYKALKTYTPTTVISSDSGVWMEADLVDSDILYPHAENTSYDNSTSGLTSDNVQAAIDENAEAISALNSSIVVNEFLKTQDILESTQSYITFDEEMIPDGYSVISARCTAEHPSSVLCGSPYVEKNKAIVPYISKQAEQGETFYLYIALKRS